jgi:hypothetical protein
MRKVFAMVFPSLWLTLRSFQYLCYVTSNSKMTDELLIEKYVEGSGRGLDEILSLNLPGRIEETTKNLSKNRRCPGKDSSQAQSVTARPTCSILLAHK